MRDDWVAVDCAGSLKWYLVWQLDSAGYVVSRGRKHCQHIADQWRCWVGAVSEIVEVTEREMGTSRLSMLKRDVREAAAIHEAEQEHWCSTKALVALWLHWCGSHRRRDAKDRSNASFRRFLASTLPSSDCKKVLELPDPTALPGCPEYVPGNPCQHINASRVAAGSHSSPQHDLAEFLLRMWALRKCPVVLQKLQISITNIALTIDGSSDAWGEKGWALSQDAWQESATKRRRLAERVATSVLTDAVRSGKFGNAASAAKAMDHVDKSQAHRYVLKEVAAFRESLRTHAATQDCIALAVDASRIGKPKEDLLLGALSLPSAWMHGVAVPQVLAGGLRRRLFAPATLGALGGGGGFAYVQLFGDGQSQDKHDVRKLPFSGRRFCEYHLAKVQTGVGGRGPETTTNKGCYVSSESGFSASRDQYPFRSRDTLQKHIPVSVGAPQVLRDMHSLAGQDIQRMSPAMRSTLRAEGVRILRAAFVDNLTPLELMDREVADRELGLRLARQANRDYIQQVDHMLRETTSNGLAAFQPARRWVCLSSGEHRYREAAGPAGAGCRRRCARQLPHGERVYECPVEHNEDGSEKYKILHVSIDQGQHGLAAWLWALLGKGLRMTLTCDIFHRVHNDVLAATAASGLASVRLDACHILKYKEGPFKSESNASVLREAARDLLNTVPASNALWDMMYSAVVLENGMSEHNASFGTEAHVESSWTSVLTAASSRATGEQTRPSRWFAFERASRRAVAGRHLDLLLLLWLGTRRGWWKDVSTNPLMAQWSPAPEGASAEAAGEAVAEAVNVDGEENGDKDAAEVGVATSMAKAKEEAQDRRKTVRSGLQFVLHLLLQEKACKQWQAMVQVTIPLEEFMAEAHESIKTLRGTTHWFTLRSRTGMDDAVRRLLANWWSEAMQKLLLCDGSSNAARVCAWTPDDELEFHTAMWNYLVNLAGEIALTGLSFRNPPCSFLALASPYEAVVAETLVAHHLHWKAFSKLEKVARDDPGAKEFLDNCLIHQQQFVMEVYVRLHEEDFRMVPDSLKTRLAEYSRTWLSSLVCEHLWNSARKGAATTTTGRFGLPTTYHHIACASECLESFGRRPVEIAPSARMSAPSKLPATMFTRQPASCSLSEEDLRHMQSTSPDWPTATGASLKKSALGWQAMTVCAGNWERLQKAWHSLLARPGYLINNKGTGLLLLCLGSSSNGALTWRVGCRTDTRELYIPASTKLETQIIENPGDWNATSIEVRQVVNSAGCTVVSPCVARKGCELLKFAALMGFPGLNLYFLKKLSAEQGLSNADIEKPLVVDNYVKALATVILGPQATADVLKLALLRRNGLTSRKCVGKDGPFGGEEEDGTDECADMEHCGVDEDEQLADLRAESRAVAAAERRRMEKLRAIERAFGVAPPNNDVLPAPKQRTFVAVQPGGITAEEAKQFLPKGVRIYKDTSRENRWRMFSPHIGKERTKSYGRRSAVDDWGAMTHLILLAWQAERQRSGVECPFQFQELRSQLVGAAASSGTQ